MMRTFTSTKTTARLAATALAVAAVAPAARAAVVTIDNDTGVATAGNATFGRQEFTPNVGGPGTGDTVASSLPLPTTVYLDAVTFKGRTSTGGSTGPLYLDVYAGAGDAGTYVGSSTNAVTVSGAGDNVPLAWTFPSLPLNASTLYSIVASPDAVAGNSGTFRVEAADGNTTTTGAQNSYNGGASSGTANGAALAFDARFTVTLNTVPEPTGAAVVGFAGIGLLARRRRIGVGGRS